MKKDPKKYFVQRTACGRYWSLYDTASGKRLGVYECKKWMIDAMRRYNGYSCDYIVLGAEAFNEVLKVI